MRAKKFYLELLMLAPVFFGYAYFLTSNYIYGDQIHYRLLYDALSDADFWDVPLVSLRYISASDLLSFYVLWVGAGLGIDKDIYIALANTLMLSELYLLARRCGINYSMIALLMCNFYVIVLMTGAERLKLAFIFIFLAALADQKKWKMAFGVGSIFLHLQSIILLASLVLNYYKYMISKALHGRLPKRDFLIFVSILFLVWILLYNMLDSINSKFESYSEGGSLAGALQIAIFLLAGLLFINNRFGFFISLLPLMIATLFIGGERVNMIAVFAGVYLFWVERKGNHPFLYVTMIYFLFKSVPFVSNILKYGDGFSGI